MSSVIPFCAYYGGVMNELRDLFGILLENAIEMIIIQDKNGIILLNKSDLNSVISQKDVEKYIHKDIINISAKHNTGIDDLEECIKKMFFANLIYFS